MFGRLILPMALVPGLGPALFIISSVPLFVYKVSVDVLVVFPTVLY